MKYKFLMISLAIVLSVFTLASCKNEGVAVTTTAGDVNDTTPLPDVVLDAEGLAKYSIIRSDDATTDEKKLCNALSADIEKAMGSKIKAESDFLFNNQTAGEYEILIGETNREESVEIYDKIKYNDYIIAVKGSKIVVAGGSFESLTKGVEYFASLFKNDGLVLAGDYVYEYNAEYQFPDMKLEGVNISEYKIVYAGDGQLTAASIIRNKIGEMSGNRLKLVHNKEDKTDYEIVVGNTNRYKYDTCAYYNYEVFNDGKSIYFNAYDLYALNSAALRFAEKLEAGGGSSTLKDVEFSYELPDYKEYIKDIDKLYMRWEYCWTPDPLMLDYSGKLDAFRSVSDRLLTCAHRAECYYYPENSIESIISFYKMGGDVVELDIQATSDGVLILMHDNNLKRMTNWDEFAEKTIDGITFPESANVSEWTYEQLQYLNLKEGAGGSGAKMTPFKIPTLTEALEVCKGRLLIIPDKTDKWSYLPGGGRADLFSCMKEADNYESIIISYGTDASYAMSVQKYIYDASGVKPLMLVRSNGDPLKDVYNKFVDANAAEGTYGVQVNGRFNPDSFPERYKETYDALRGKILMWGWTISDVNNGYPDSMDCEENWQKMCDLGYRMIMSNKYLELVKFAATKMK